MNEPSLVAPSDKALDMRIGHGFDVHAFLQGIDPERPLVLGGVIFPGEPALKGHSDADAIAHAVTDALLGATGMGDIGTLFPDTDPRWKGADSMSMLAEVVSLIHGAGWTVVNVDCTVVAERPKISPRRDEIVAAVSAVVEAPAFIKGKRPEGLGALGRSEGLSCTAVALLAADR